MSLATLARASSSLFQYFLLFSGSWFFGSTRSFANGVTFHMQFRTRTDIMTVWPRLCRSMTC